MTQKLTESRTLGAVIQDSKAEVSQLSEDPHSSLTLVCSTCRAGPFSHQAFRQAISERPSDAGYCYTTTWANISQSISYQSCSWCNIVRRTRDGLPPVQLPPPSKEDVEVRFQVWMTELRKDLEIYLNGYQAATYKIYANPGDSAAVEIGTEAIISPKQLYVDYPRVLNCIKQCSGHEQCPTIKETHLPTRVIDCSDPSKPRLVETGRQILGHYCALSYAWGGEQHQKTTTSNIDIYVHEGINIPLPPTIADAILATHKLGVRYLWVDALCIIQDSNEDKANELTFMAHIYRNAYVTISASSAYRADHGFLPDERPPDVLPFFPACKSTPPGRMVLEYTIKPSSGLVLEERGWCLQESMLSPRRLSFHPPIVSYKCRSFSEWHLRQGYSDLGPYPANDYILFPTDKNLGTSTGIPDEVGTEDLLEQWQEILWDYSRRKITVPSDKLVALASIAEVFQSLLQDQYIAGLWRRSLIDDLLWEVQLPRGPDGVHLPRPLRYRAPTWSWASVDGQLHISYTIPPASMVDYEAKILACEVTPRNPTFLFGEITDARLTMKVKMHPLMRDGRKCSFIERKGTVSEGGLTSHCSWTPPAGNCFGPGIFSIGRYMSDGERGGQPIIGEIMFDCLEGTEQDRQMDFYVIILRACKIWANKRPGMGGLIVLPVEGKVDQYRRVAKLDLKWDFQWLDWFDAMALKTVTLI